MKTIILAAGAVLLALPSPGRAQTPNEILSYTAITRTPVGALPPMLTNTLLDRLQNGASLAIRYGNLASGDFNPTTHAIAVSGVLPAGLGSSLSITAGVMNNQQQTGVFLAAEQRTELMLGVGGDLRLIGSAMGNTSTSPLWTVSLDGQLGYGNADPGTLLSGSVGLPIALVQRGQGMQFVPFITPAFVFGRFSQNGASDSGSGLMLGGGLGIYNTESSVTINAGAQHQFMNGARNVVGISVLFGGK